MPEIKLEEMETREGFMRSRKPEQVTLLPDPPRAHRHLPIISTDDHLVEPPDMFEGRMPAKFADLAPRVVDRDGGSQAWLFDGKVNPRSVWRRSPVARSRSAPTNRCASTRCARRRGTSTRAVHDMDLDGVYASVCFPSALAGFCGHRLQLGVSDPELALGGDARRRTTGTSRRGRVRTPTASSRARSRGCSIPRSPPRRCAATRHAGFKAISFSENPEPLGLPSIHTGYWDPLLAACEETETVVCLHVGSSGATPTTSSDAPGDCIGVLFFGFAMFAAVDWLYSKIPVRFPNMKLCLSEGGVGWVAGLLDRLDHVGKYQAIYGTWEGIDLTPREVMQRNFWFCSLEDESAFDVIGPHRCGPHTVETDYPHLDGTWPDSQEILWRQLGHLPRADRRQDRVAQRVGAVPPPGARRRGRRSRTAGESGGR